MWVYAIAGHDGATAWSAKHGYPLQRAAAEGVNSVGGFLVPTEIESAIIALRETRGVFRANAQVIRIGSDTTTRPRRTGGLTATFTPEATTVGEGQVGWDNVTLVAKKLATLTRASSELVDDAAMSVGEILASEIAYAFASKEDDCGWNGDGTSTYGGIRGVTQLLIDGSHNAGKVAGAAGHNTFGTLDIADLTNAMGKLPSYALPGAAWYISVMGFATCFCRLAGAGGGIQVVNGRLNFMGLPVEIANVLPTSTAALTSQVMLAVGDLSLAASLAEARGVTMRVAKTRYLENDQIGFLGTERVDIVCHDLGDNTTAGPVVGLIGTA
jgi:HK97 family phage major capsid protein